jgi:hypothetical protein
VLRSIQARRPTKKKAGKARLILSGVVLVALGAFLGSLVWARWGSLTAAPATLKGRYATEEQWIAGEIARDILEMAQYAGGSRSPSKDDRFSVEPAGGSPGVAIAFTPAGRPEIRETVLWKRHIWAPEDYEALARSALQASGVTAVAGTPADPETVLRTLTTPQAAVIETESQRVSQRLAASMADAGAHEEAALVVGALALRESSGNFWDVRQLLSRMTAHLAMARALRGTADPGISGRYADVVLAASVNRAREAVGKLDALEAAAGGSETQRAWVRALRMSITEDWRVLADPAQASLLERLQYYQALGGTLGGASASHYYGSVETEPVTDWGRIALSNSFGTEVGEFVQEGVDPEISEAKQVWGSMNGRDLADADLVTALNRPAERCVTAAGPRVLGWGTWAASVQRHLGNRVLAINRFWQQIQSLPDRAQATRDTFDARWSGLVIYPFVQGLRWQHGAIELESFSGALNTAVATTAQRPEVVNAGVWDSMTQTASYAVTRRRMPAMVPWFAAPAPAGTAYDAGIRAHSSNVPQPPIATLTALRELHPWHPGLIQRVIERFGPKPTVAQVRGVVGQKTDYDVGLLRMMANAAGGQSPERAQLLGQACGLLADTCVELAHHLAAARRDAEAVDALKRAFERAENRVSLTHAILPLVRHHHERGEQSQATRVAQDAAGTGSAPGMRAMGLLLEWRGRLKEAEEYFEQIEERYRDPRQVAAFSRRMVDAGHKDYQSKLDRALRAAFPNGLERLDAAQLPPVPKDGMGLSQPGPDAPLSGLEAGDIVVGVDGWRVRSYRQYLQVAAFDWRPDMKMHVWRKGRYLEVPVHLFNRWIPLEQHTHPTGGHAER